MVDAETVDEKKTVNFLIGCKNNDPLARRMGMGLVRIRKKQQADIQGREKKQINYSFSATYDILHAEQLP